MSTIDRYNERLVKNFYEKFGKYPSENEFKEIGGSVKYVKRKYGSVREYCKEIIPGGKQARRKNHVIVLERYPGERSFNIVNCDTKELVERLECEKAKEKYNFKWYFQVGRFNRVWHQYWIFTDHQYDVIKWLNWNQKDYRDIFYLKYGTWLYKHKENCKCIEERKKIKNGELTVEEALPHIDFSTFPKTYPYGEVKKRATLSNKEYEVYVETGYIPPNKIEVIKR